MGTFNKCRLVETVFIIILYNGPTWAESNMTNVESLASVKNETNPSSVESRFFDLGSLINQFLPGTNMGNQRKNTGFPDNSQIFPGNQKQNKGYERPKRQDWHPVIDDAQTYPENGRVDTNKVIFFNPQQLQYPNQVNEGGFNQNQNQGNGPRNFDGVNANPGNQYPNHDNQYFGAPNQINVPYPNQNNFGNQYPRQEHITGEQYPNQGNFGGTPMQYPGPSTPNQSNFGNQYPNPGLVNGNQYQRPGIGYPNTKIPDQNNVGNQYSNSGSVNGGQYERPAIGYPNVQLSIPDQNIFGNQYPNLGAVNGGQYERPGIEYPDNQPSTPDQGDFGNQYPNPGPKNGGQYPMQGIGSINQYPNSGPANPNQSNFNQHRNQGLVNGGPGVGGSGSVSQYPQQGGFQPDQPNFRPGSGLNNPDDGALDSIIPPEQNDFSSPNNHNGNAILGKPVHVPMSTIPPEQIVYPENRDRKSGSSTEDPPKKQCSQDCQTSSEYSPVCGSNGITYYNPGRFFCARNCGINVFVKQEGRCPSAEPSSTKSPVQ